jgi:hypothetical protein
MVDTLKCAETEPSDTNSQPEDVAQTKTQTKRNPCILDEVNPTVLLLHECPYFKRFVKLS